MEPLLASHEVAALLGRNTRWVRDAARDGTLPSFKVGGAVRFRESQIEVWLAGQQRGPHTPVRQHTLRRA